MGSGEYCFVEEMQNGRCTSSKYCNGNMQKALQKYVGFSGMDSEYCDRIGDLMDRAQNWCLDIKELYNKAEVHSNNTSKGDVGIISDNSQVTVFEFLELAYLG